MTGAPIDFASVQWARRTLAKLQPILTLSPDEMTAAANRLDLPETDEAKVQGLVEKVAALPSAPSAAQMTVLLQYLHTKNLDALADARGGLAVSFSGAGYEYERFLLREDGRIPNHRYESKKAL